MAGKDIIIMNMQELRRLPVIHNVINMQLTQKEAADTLGLSDRQVRRIIAKVKTEGDQAIIHCLRSKTSNRATAPDKKDKILDLCRTRYKGFNPTFAAEKLFEIDKIQVNRETLRGWFIDSDIDYKKRRAPKHRSWRPRKESYGQMIQLDGSHHNWLEGRGPKCVLMGYIDDATGSFFGRFYGFEGTIPAMDSFKRYIKKYGIPQSIYLDNHSTYKSTKRPTIEDELTNQRALSQMGRIFKDLGVDIIYADSPQAKGRIERSFGTHQDRLVKEMRLADISSIRDANRFLACYYTPKHNRKFTVPAKNKADLHRPIPEKMDLDRIFCIKNQACLRNDFTIRYNSIYYQILDVIRSKKVDIEERLNGRLYIYHKDTQLRYTVIDKRPQKPNVSYEPRQKYIIPKDHPWRKFKIKCA